MRLTTETFRSTVMPSPQKLKLMIVEDHAAFRQVLKGHLQALAAEFVECEDGQDAVDQYPQAQPDFVLMDIAMKRLDGLTATRLIKARFAAARILILTQYDDPDLREVARRAGACAYVLKDDLSQLQAILQSHLRTAP